MEGASAPATGPQRAMRSLKSAQHDPHLAQHDLFAGILQVLSFESATPVAAARPPEGDRVSSASDREERTETDHADREAAPVAKTPETEPAPPPPEVAMPTIQNVAQQPDSEDQSDDAEVPQFEPTDGEAAEATLPTTKPKRDPPADAASGKRHPQQGGEEVSSADEAGTTHAESATQPTTKQTRDAVVSNEQPRQAAKSSSGERDASPSPQPTTPVVPAPVQPRETQTVRNETEAEQPVEQETDDSAATAAVDVPPDDGRPRRRGRRGDERHEHFAGDRAMPAKGALPVPPTMQATAAIPPADNATAEALSQEIPASVTDDVEAPSIDPVGPATTETPSRSAAVHAPAEAMGKPTEAAGRNAGADRATRVDGVSRTEPKTPQLASGGKSSETKDSSSMRSVDRARLILRVSRAFHRIGDTGGVVRLRLHPESLGSVRVEVGVQDRRVTAVMLTENEQARNVLAENLSGLRTRLAEQGIQVESIRVEVDAGESSYQQPHQHNDNPHPREWADQARQARTARRAPTESTTQPELETPRSRPVRHEGALDLQL